MPRKLEFQLVLIDDGPDDGQSRTLIEAPPDFNWLLYPDFYIHEGITYKYIGTIDIPHYRRIK